VGTAKKVTCFYCKSPQYIKRHATRFDCAMCGRPNEAVVDASPTPVVGTPVATSTGSGPSTERAGGVIGLVVVVIAAIWLWNQCSDAFSGGAGQTFSGDVVSYEPVDVANLMVTFRLTNKGTEAAKGECTIEAHDASRIVGFDIFSSRQEIAPGDSIIARGAIRIEDEGAFRVRRVEARDCGEA
jgi:ribosomal protein L37AE/L43A